MSVLRLLFLSSIGIILILLAVTNRELVVIRIIPEEFSAFMPVPSPIELPLFLVIFVGVFLGLLIGFIWEWMRERRQRLQAAAERRKIAKLEKEIEGLKKNSGDGSDILALLE